MLAVLRRHRVRATFFVLGEQLAYAPRLGRALADGGHEVAVHGWDHRCLLRRGPSAVYDDLARTVETIERHTGDPPALHACAVRRLHRAGLLAGSRLGLEPVLWTCWGRDWTRRATPASVASTVIRGLSGGGTILLHDSDVAAAPGSWRATVGALPRVLDHCRAHGLAVGPLIDHGDRRGDRLPTTDRIIE